MKEEMFMVDIKISPPFEKEGYERIRKLIKEQNVDFIGSFRVIEENDFLFACKISISNLINLIKEIRKINGVYGSDIMTTETEIFSKKFPENKIITLLVLDLIPGRDDEVIDKIKLIKTDKIMLGSLGFMFDKYYEDAFVFFFADDMESIGNYVEKVREIEGVKDTKWKILV